MIGSILSSQNPTNIIIDNYQIKRYRIVEKNNQLPAYDFSQRHVFLFKITKMLGGLEIPVQGG